MCIARRSSSHVAAVPAFVFRIAHWHLQHITASTFLKISPCGFNDPQVGSANPSQTQASIVGHPRGFPYLDVESGSSLCYREHDVMHGRKTPNKRAGTKGQPPFVPTNKIAGLGVTTLQSVTAMPQYETLSAEELRIVDYGWDQATAVSIAADPFGTSVSQKVHFEAPAAGFRAIISTGDSTRPSLGTAPVATPGETSLFGASAVPFSFGVAVTPKGPAVFWRYSPTMVWNSCCGIHQCSWNISVCSGSVFRAEKHQHPVAFGAAPATNGD